jgi:TetR/AcrR family transcriptional regulator, transcriptional repressor of aconitase
MPKVTDAHRAARRDEILDAAQRVFARKGYRGSSIAAIIDESGLSAGAIYSYFEGKQELFHAVVERTLAVRTSQIAAGAGEQPRSPGELIRSVLVSMRGQPISTIAPQIWAEAAVEPETRKVVARVYEQLGRMLCAELTAWASGNPARVDGDPEAWAARVTPVLISVVPGFMAQRMTMSGFDEDAYLDALVDAFRG